MKNTPLISCLCITNNRSELLKKSIFFFQKQTYTNKELVILYKSDDTETLKIKKTSKDNRIKWVEISPSVDISLGAQRNISIEQSSGEYICNWDDDDWYHKDRLKIQYNYLSKSYKKACAILNYILYDYTTGQAYLSQTFPWPQTLMCKKEILIYPCIYGDTNRHEDKHLLLQLVEKNYIFPIVSPTLYIYIFRGNNVSGAKHFKGLISISQKLSESVNKFIKDTIEGNNTYQEACLQIQDEFILADLNYFIH